MATSSKVRELFEMDIEIWSADHVAAWATASGIDATGLTANEVTGNALQSMPQEDFVKMFGQKAAGVVFAQVQALKKRGPEGFYRAWALDNELGKYLVGGDLGKLAAGKILQRARQFQAHALRPADRLYFFVLVQLLNDTTNTQRVYPMIRLVTYTDVRTGLVNTVKWNYDGTIRWTIVLTTFPIRHSIQIIYAADTCEITDLITDIERERRSYPLICMLYDHEPPPDTRPEGCGGITVTVLRDDTLYISLRRLIVNGIVDMRGFYAECFVQSFGVVLPAANSTFEIYWNYTQREHNTIGVPGSSCLPVDLSPQTHQMVARTSEDMWKQGNYDEWSRTPELLQYARDWNLRFDGEGSQWLVSAEMCIGAIELTNPGENRVVTLKLKATGGQRFVSVDLRPEHQGVSEVYVARFFYQTKTYYPDDFKKIMGIIKPVLGRTPMGLLNDTSNVLCACPWAVGPVKIGLQDAWHGWSEGDVTVETIDIKTKIINIRGLYNKTIAGYTTGTYSLKPPKRSSEDRHNNGSFSIDSGDLRSVAERAITTYRLEKCGDPAIRFSIADQTVTHLFSSPDTDGCIGITFKVSAIEYKYDGEDKLRMDAWLFSATACRALARPGLLYVDIIYQPLHYPLRPFTSDWSATDVRVWAISKLLEPRRHIINDEFKLFTPELTGRTFATLTPRDLQKRYKFSKDSATFLQAEFAALSCGPPPTWKLQEMMYWTAPTTVEWATDIGLHPKSINWIISKDIDGSTLAVLDQPATIDQWILETRQRRTLPVPAVKLVDSSSEESGAGSSDDAEPEEDMHLGLGQKLLDAIEQYAAHTPVARWRVEEMGQWNMQTVRQWAIDKGLDPRVNMEFEKSKITGEHLEDPAMCWGGIFPTASPAEKDAFDSKIKEAIRSTVSPARCPPSVDNVAFHHIDCSGDLTPNQGRAGGSNFGWIARHFQIFERIKNDNLGAIARWGYYGKLYGGENKQLHKGYLKLTMPFTDTAS